MEEDSMFITPSDKDVQDVINSVSIIIQDIISTNSNMYEKYTFDKDIKYLIYQHFDSILTTEEFDKIYNENYYEMFKLSGYKVRSYASTFISQHDNNQQIEHLREKEQPDQRTPEWYNFRHEHITASNAWKCFGNEKAVNSIVFEKLKPLDIEKYKPTFSENPLTWGQKFEPISVGLYESIYGVKVIDLGCLEHEEYQYLAASPDGLVVSERNNGRLLEIKNVVSREITKIPKMEYWIQMQLQMEVCDLDECDFLETKFVEFDSYNEFINYQETDKGIIMVFVKDGYEPIYKYSKLHEKENDYFNSFMDDMTAEMTNLNGDYQWVKNIYWKLITFSCIFVPRNKTWFVDNIHKISEAWEIIESERNNVNGPDIDKYKPQKRVKTSTDVTIDMNKPVPDVSQENDIIVL